MEIKTKYLYSQMFMQQMSKPKNNTINGSQSSCACCDPIIIIVVYPSPQINFHLSLYYNTVKILHNIYHSRGKNVDTAFDIIAFMYLHCGKYIILRYLNQIVNTHLFYQEVIYSSLYKIKLMKNMQPTVWKLHDFSITQILREINFGILEVQNLPF